MERGLRFSYEHYRHCDDGAVSEGYSNSRAVLPTEHWDQIGDFITIYRAHPKFEEFVLCHVDELMTQDQAKQLQRDAKSKCPTNASKLCARLENRLDEFASH